MRDCAVFVSLSFRMNLDKEGCPFMGLVDFDLPADA
jgi:hypothetical protein